MASRSIVINDYDKILEYLSSKSESITKLLTNEPDWEYMLIRKNISHSDLINSGKRNGMQEGLDKNYLYYLSQDEMEEIEATRNKPFESAKQSNIFMTSEFYSFIGMPELQRREGAQTTQHEHPIVNNYADVYLVNDTLEYFDIDYTKKVFEKLGKNPTTWHYDDYKVNLSTGDFTPIQLTHAIHGIGTSDDPEFRNLRRSMFKNDSMMVLMRKKDDRKEIYILLEKNPKFYTIIGMGNASWEKYLEQNNKQELFELLKKNNLNEDESEKTRKNQSKWRNLLADEMTNYTPNDDEIFCPLTYITVNFENAGTLFRASHIKGFADCNVDEAFDINNGIIMIANADALFDKHLITIQDDGTITFSYLLQNDFKLKQELRLTEKVFAPILNDERKRYLAYHREVFAQKEELRRRDSSLVDDSTDEETL